MDTNNKQLPLQDIRVIAFTHAVMGPAAGMILADMGAEVIHLEPPAGDATRRLKGFGVGYYPYFTRNMKSLAVDLKSPEGKDIVYKLIRSADVVIENFGPGTMDRLGYGYDALSKENPGLVYCSLKGFMPGPYEKRVAMDEVVQMMGGLAYMTGPPGQPLRAGTSIIDITGGMFGVIGIITALYDRKKTGVGAEVKSSLFETTAFVMGQHMACSAITKEPVPPMPVRVSAWSVYRLFETRDEDRIFIGLISEKHWQNFCKAFNRADWLEDERLNTNNGRIEQRDWFLPEVEKMIKQYTKSEVVELCDRAGICFSPVSRPEDLFDDPQLNQDQNGLIDTVFPGGIKTKMPRLPVRINDYDFGLRNDPAEAIGADTAELLGDLGFSNEEIKALAERQVIKTGD
jgi:crotonobetainyl-CoA:carnitine CoA-transferase CaiB-like acyl-CoA transferase